LRDSDSFFENKMESDIEQSGWRITLTLIRLTQRQRCNRFPDKALDRDVVIMRRSRQTVNELLRHMEEEGIIQCQRGGVRVHDAGRLREAARGAA
jgi:hypothetical protein